MKKHIGYFTATMFVAAVVYVNMTCCGFSKHTTSTEKASLLVVSAEEPRADEFVEIVEVEIEQPLEEKTKTYLDVPLAAEVQDRIFSECEKHKLDPSIVIAMIERESRFNEHAVGDDGRSAGLMQIQAKWHLQRMIDLDCTDLFEPCQNVTVGIDILAELYNKYGNDYGKALTAYNRGSYQGPVTSYAKEILDSAEKFDVRGDNK